MKTFELVLPINDRIGISLEKGSTVESVFVENNVICIRFVLANHKRKQVRTFLALKEFEEPAEKNIFLGVAETTKGRYDVFEIIYT